MALGYAVGDRIPDMTLEDHSGEQVSLSTVAGGAPLILVFYRGYW